MSYQHCIAALLRNFQVIQCWRQDSFLRSTAVVSASFLSSCDGMKNLAGGSEVRPSAAHIVIDSFIAYTGRLQLLIFLRPVLYSV